jgi:hypothetical protein
MERCKYSGITSQKPKRERNGTYKGIKNENDVVLKTSF